MSMVKTLAVNTTQGIFKAHAVRLVYGSISDVFDWYLSQNGTESDNCGTVGNPCKTMDILLQNIINRKDDELSPAQSIMIFTDTSCEINGKIVVRDPPLIVAWGGSLNFVLSLG